MSKPNASDRERWWKNVYLGVALGTTIWAGVLYVHFTNATYDLHRVTEQRDAALDILKRMVHPPKNPRIWKKEPILVEPFPGRNVM